MKQSNKTLNCKSAMLAGASSIILSTLTSTAAWSAESAEELLIERPEQICIPNLLANPVEYLCLLQVDEDGIYILDDNISVTVGEEGAAVDILDGGIQLDVGAGGLELSVLDSESVIANQAVDGLGIGIDAGDAVEYIDLLIEGDILSEGTGLGIDTVGGIVADVDIQTSNITATVGRGIDIDLGDETQLNNIDLDVLGTVNAGTDGIYLILGSGGFTTIDTQDINALTGLGLYALSSGAGLSLNTNGDITAEDIGINLGFTNLATGDVTIMSTNVYSQNAEAVNVSTGSNNVNVFADLNGTQNGGTDSVVIDHNGTGGVDIQAENLTARGGSGLVVDNAASGTFVDTTIIGTVSSTFYGVEIANNGSGNTDILSFGDINSQEDAIHTRSVNDVVLYAQGDVVSVLDDGFDVRSTAGSVIVQAANGANFEGVRYGIVSFTEMGSDIQIAAGATVTGDVGAIALRGISGATNLNDTIQNAGLIDGDVTTSAGDDTFILSATGSLTEGSRIDLGLGTDEFILDGGNLATADIRGGLGFDSLVLRTGGGTFGSSGKTIDTILSFEEVRVTGNNWVIEGTQFNYDLFTFGATDTVLDARVYADTAVVTQHNGVDMADGSLINGIVINNGTINIGGIGTVGSTLVNGQFVMSSSGEMVIDAVAPGSNDLFRVNGDVDLDGTLIINQTYALGTGQYIVLNGTEQLTGTFRWVEGLGSGAGLTQSIFYDVPRANVWVRTEVQQMAAEDTGSKSSASAANYLVGAIGSESHYSELGYAVGTLGSFAEIGEFASGVTPDVLDSAVLVSDGAALRFGQSLAGCDMNFSLNAAESCAAEAGQSGPAMFGEIRQTSANTGTEIGHNFNAQSFDMNVGMRLTDANDRTQFGLMSGYAKSGSVSDAIAGDSRDGLEAESFSFGGYARRDAGWWSLDGTAMISTSEAKLVRNITPGLGIAEQAQSEFVSRQVDVQGTATLNGLGSSELVIKPLATLGNRTLQRDGFTESGADLLGLTVDGQTRNVSYAGVGAEFAPDFTDESGNGFKGLMRVTGLAYAGDTASDFTARFTHAPGDSSFTYFGRNLDTSVLLEGGFQYIAGDGFAIGAEGFGEVNPDTGDSSSVGATLQLIKRW